MGIGVSVGVAVGGGATVALAVAVAPGVGVRRGLGESLQATANSVRTTSKDQTRSEHAIHRT
jgi:hypothetical protein